MTQSRIHRLATVSVVIPYYNAADTLELALKSIAEQTYSALETIVIDDASTEEQATAAASIIAGFMAARLVRLERNSGPSAARNRGIDEARGEFVALLDADDRWLPQKLEKCLQLMQRHKLDFLGHNNIIVEDANHRSTTDCVRSRRSIE